MKYQVEDVSSTRKHIVVTVPKDEVDASILANITIYKKQITIKGYRKGNAPDNFVEQTYKTQIYDTSKQDLINVHINTITQELNVNLISALMVNDKNEFTRGQDFTYTIDFDVMPTIELPNYEGLNGVQAEIWEASQKDIEALMMRECYAHAEYHMSKDKEPARDGDIASVQFSVYKDGKPIPGMEQQHFDLMIGSNSTLPEFEDLVKTLKIGEKGEKEITFPANFINAEYAGKALLCKAKVKSVKRLFVPAFNNALAKRLNCRDAEDLKQALISARNKQLRDNLKQAAKNYLVDQLMKQVDVPAPEILVNHVILNLIAKHKDRLEQRGMNADFTEEELKVLHEQYRPSAELEVKKLVLLMSIAKKEDIQLRDIDVQRVIEEEAARYNVPYDALRRQYEHSGEFYYLADKILAQKAEDLIYARAHIEMVSMDKFEEIVSGKPKAADSEAAGSDTQAAADSEAAGSDTQAAADSEAASSDTQAAADSEAAGSDAQVATDSEAANSDTQATSTQEQGQ
ncbi:MAG: trigger factor [Desulfovibrionaceae bacterium]|nr:trigger factor [Desulfovibrionaceae bacterium]